MNCLLIIIRIIREFKLLIKWVGYSFCEGDVNNYKLFFVYLVNNLHNIIITQMLSLDFSYIIFTELTQILTSIYPIKNNFTS